MTCSSCGADVAPGGRFCLLCGESVDVGEKRIVGRNCPYCHFPLGDGATPVMECESCYAPHHDECWSENGGCAVASCERGPDGSVHSTLPTSVMPAAGRPADKLQVDLGPAAAGRAPEPAMRSPGGSRRRGRGLWIALVVGVMVAILAGGATAAVLIATKKDPGDTSAQDSPVRGDETTSGTAPPVPPGASDDGPPPEDLPAGDRAFTTASSDVFSVEVPTTWNLKTDAEKIVNGDDVLYRSEWSAEDDGALRIDRVPGDRNEPAENARIVPKARKARAEREGEQYRLASLKPITLDGQKVWEWVYEIDGSSIVDYFLSIDGNSYGVQTTGTTLDEERRIGSHAVTTLDLS